jgi:putrescine transport system permease protein
MCYAAVVVQARLQDFDKSVEEAAMDLGATPVSTFFQITLPIIAPSVVSAWLLAFTLSLDDLVIASFTTGPGATTLPMKIYVGYLGGLSAFLYQDLGPTTANVTVGVLSAAYFTKRQTERAERERRKAFGAAG